MTVEAAIIKQNNLKQQNVGLNFENSHFSVFDYYN
jgi:hypothetical protein